ncbi:MAG TPA: NAD-dependent epimerase/dehydratase family protein, partial [Bdellovibrionales bacterium]|nr:NAD-dependent epimerase/dehydratase family protein [Bdellovibrionales bacterium]
MSGSRILVTGAAGFIGFHLVKKLAAVGHSVFGLDNLNSYYAPSLKRDRLRQLEGVSRFSFEKLDLNDPKIGAYVSEINPEGVVHLAAQAG